MKIDRYFVGKAVSLAVVVAIIAACNRFLGRENEIKAEALAEQERQVAENAQIQAAQDGGGTNTGSGEADAGGSSQLGEESQTGEATAAGKYVDGTYDGEAEGFGGLVQVRVVVSGGSIESVEVLYAGKEDAAYLESAKAVIAEMESSGDTDVDTVSGATYSSTGIINAAKQALEAAK